MLWPKLTSSQNDGSVLLCTKVLVVDRLKAVGTYMQIRPTLCLQRLADHGLPEADKTAASSQISSNQCKTHFLVANSISVEKLVKFHILA